MDYEVLENPDIQDLKNRAEDVIDSLTVIVEQLYAFIQSIIILIGIISIITSLNPFIIIVSILIVLFNSAITKRREKKDYQITKEIQSKLRKQYGISNNLHSLEYAKDIRIFNAGAYLLLLGLCFEPFQEGIKKDPATFSYFFVTSGLAFLALLFLSIVCDYFRCVRSSRFLVMSGQNPMIAYVVGDLFIMPLANILGLASLLSYFQQNAWLGFLQGVIITSLAVLVTMFFTKIKWFWRT